MAQYYANNKEYLNDCFAFIDLLREPSSTRLRMEKPPERPKETLLSMYRDIRDKARASRSHGVSIPLERLARKNKLDDIEALILLICVYATVISDDELSKLTHIRKLVLSFNNLDQLSAMGYWRRDSKLIKKGILLPSFYRANLPSATPYELAVEPSLLDRVLGRKAARRAKKAARLLPQEIHRKLGEYVVGQDRAKRTIATAVYKHQQISRLNRKRKGLDRLQKSNILLLGPTGTGKTHLCRTLAKVLDAPFVICDATQYTETGYVGACVEEMLEALHKAAGNDLKRMEGGIIYIDEIDKLAQTAGSPSNRTVKDISGKSVQEELLKMLEGDKVSHKGVDYDVGSILFIAGGAFAGMEEVVGARLKQGRMGFSAGRAQGEAAAGDILAQVGTEDLIAYGFMPEFVGRFAGVVTLDALGRDELVRIMTEPKNSLLSQYRTVFGASGMDLRVPQPALEWVAQRALDNKTGARGLKAILEECLGPILFENGSAAAGGTERVPLKEVVFEPAAAEQPKLREA